MKYVLWIVIIALVGFGAWWFITNEAPADNLDGTANEDMSHDDMNVTDGTSASVDLNITDAPDAVFQVSGTNFEFSDAELRVKQGDIVRIEFTSTGGTHDWVLDAFDANTAVVNTGETSSVTFVADQVGEFEYYCSVGQHRALGMVGTLIVEE